MRFFCLMENGKWQKKESRGEKEKGSRFKKGQKWNKISEIKWLNCGIKLTWRKNSKRKKIDMTRRIAKEWCQEIGKVNEALKHHCSILTFELTCLVKQYFVSCILYFYTLYFGICIFPCIVLYLCICKGEWIFSCGTAAFGAALACLVQHFQPDPAPCTLFSFQLSI